MLLEALYTFTCDSCLYLQHSRCRKQSGGLFRGVVSLSPCSGRPPLVAGHMPPLWTISPLAGPPVSHTHTNSREHINSETSERGSLWEIFIESSGGSRGFEPPLFVVARACVAGLAGLVRAHEGSRKRSGQRNPPFKILRRSATGEAYQV